MPALVDIATFSEAGHAYLARGFLKSQGIPAVVADQHIVGIYWLYSNAVGGVKLRVAEEHARAAAALLAERSRASVEDAVEYRRVAGEGDTCPSCGADDVAPSKLAQRVKTLVLMGLLPALPAIPFIVWKNEWACRACGHAWKARD